MTVEEPFATITIKVYEHKDHETETQWAAVSTREHRAKVMQALESNLEILRREQAASE